MRAQGATEYLLILAAVLVVVAVAVYYVTRTTGAPTLAAVARLDNENNIRLDITSVTGVINQADWEFRVMRGTTVLLGWTAGVGRIAEGEKLTLTTGGGYQAGDVVQIRHKPTGHVYTDIPVTT
ncbi:MAG: class III signal peptide-containing protein [Candidatus Hadarchaeales archaeon]